MPPVSANLADHGYVTDALVDHYTAGTKQASHAALSCEIKTLAANEGAAGCAVLVTRILDKGVRVLAEAGSACHVLGDLKQCGNLRDAVEAGYKAACEL